MNVQLEIATSFILMFIALTVISVRDLLAMTVLLSVYSGVLALVFSMLGAPDVAFTEAVVGAGVSTGLLMALLRRVDPKLQDDVRPWTRSQWPLALRSHGLAAAVTASVGGLLLYGVHALAEFGDPATAPHLHLSAEYAARAKADTLTPNLVTAVLADYRSFDTLIETAVVLTGALACLLVLRQVRPEAVEEEA